jgi:hypothetical protein
MKQDPNRIGMTLIARLHADIDECIHPDDLEVLFLGGGFSIIHEDEETGKNVDICVSHEHQAQALIKAIKAMCAALGWKVEV